MVVDIPDLRAQHVCEQQAQQNEQLVQLNKWVAAQASLYLSQTFHVDRSVQRPLLPLLGLHDLCSPLDLLQSVPVRVGCHLYPKSLRKKNKNIDTGDVAAFRVDSWVSLWF